MTADGCQVRLVIGLMPPLCLQNFKTRRKAKSQEYDHEGQGEKVKRGSSSRVEAAPDGLLETHLLYFIAIHTHGVYEYFDLTNSV